MTLSETLNMDGLSKRIEAAPLLAAAPAQPQSSETQKSSAYESASAVEGAPTQQEMPASFSMAAPLNEAELTALLMASPLYKKLQDMKKAVAGGNFKSAPSVAPGEDESHIGDKVSWNFFNLHSNRYTTSPTRVQSWCHKRKRYHENECIVTKGSVPQTLQ